MSKRTVTKVFAKKKPSEPKMVTKVVPAKRNLAKVRNLESLVKICFACGLCNEEFSSRDLYEEHQDECHAVQNECDDKPNNDSKNLKEFLEEFAEDQFIMLDGVEADNLEYDPCEVDSSVTIKQEDDVIFENVETLEEDFLLPDDVTGVATDDSQHKEEDENENDRFEIVYLTAEEGNATDIEEDEEEEQIEEEEEEEISNAKQMKRQPRLFKAENDPHRYILETSKIYYNRGKKNPLKYTRAEKEGRELPCPQCNKKFPDGSRLKKHLATHNTERPYKCPVEGCTKDYKTPHHLKTHFYTHTMDVNRSAPYVCDYPNCYKCFGFACDLKNHKLSHEMKTNHALRKFQCSVCLKRFTKTNHLQKHSLLHLPDNQIEWIYCPEGCGKRFRHIDNVNQHLATHGYEKYQYSKRRKLKQEDEQLMELSQ